MCDGVLGVDAGDMHPVFNGFVGVALFEVKIACADGGIHGGFEVADAFRKMRHFFGGDGVVGGDLGGAQVDMQGFIHISHLEQGKPEAGERLGVVWEFFEATAIGQDGFIPFLIPCGGMSLVHCFLEDVVSTGHNGVILLLVPWKAENNYVIITLDEGRESGGSPAYIFRFKRP